MCEPVDSILREIFPSAEMASYLAKCTLTRKEMRDAVAYAAIPLERKRDIFLRLASGKDTDYFRRQAGAIEGAIREMQPKPGELFYLKRYWIYENDDEEEGLEPYLTWEHIRERIQTRLGYLNETEKELTWFVVEKWSPDGIGRLKNDYDYTVFGTEVCYFSCNDHSYRGSFGFSTYQDLYLPVPFRAGDIVTIDCRPFAPVNQAVILEVGDNQDCCCLQALYRESDGTWDTGAVKHGHASPNHHCIGISPLYRLSTFHGQLRSEDRLLDQVSRYVGGDEERGSGLWNYIFDLCDGGRKWTVTEAQFLSYIERAG